METIIKKINNTELVQADNSIFVRINGKIVEKLIGTAPEDIEQNTNYLAYKYNMNNDIKTEAEIIAEITTKIQASCKNSNYTSLCQRIQTPAGLDYAINRCINMMAKDKLHFSAALAQLEAEEEGIS